MLTCNTCKHFQSSTEYCLHSFKKGQVNYITGEIKPDSYFLAQLERRDQLLISSCGPQARFWEKVESTVLPKSYIK